MAGLMDWDAYRDKAGQETANLNKAPFVFDPAAMTADTRQNAQTLYGQGDGSGDTTGAFSKVIEQAFRDSYGRSAQAQDYRAWMAQALSAGNTPDELRQMIELSSKDPRNAGVLGTSNTDPASANFGQGIMGGGMTGNLMSGGLQFNSGLMRG